MSATVRNPVVSRRDELRAQVRRELADHLRDAAANAGRYVDGYIDSVLANRQYAPRPPAVHPLIARLAREIVLDALALERRGAGVGVPARGRRVGEWERQEGLLLDRAPRTQPRSRPVGVRSRTAASTREEA